MGTGMEGILLCHYQEHEEIHCKSSMPRPPLAPGQEVDPSSIRRGEKFPKEWAKRQRKLAKVAKEAVKKFNEDFAAEASASQPKKAMKKKSAVKPTSSPMPSWPSSAMPSHPSSSKPTGSVAQAKPLATPSKSSAPVHLATCQRTQAFQLLQELQQVPRLGLSC